MWKTIVSGLSGFANNILSDYYARRNNRRARENYKYQTTLDYYRQLALMRHQSAMNRAQYDYEYMKESPLARVGQLKQAKLNKGLMYSNGVAGMQGSVSSTSIPSSGGSISTPFQQFQPFSLSDYASLQNARSNKVVSDAQADYYRSEAEKNRAKTPHEVKNLITQNELAVAIKEDKVLEKRLKEVELYIKNASKDDSVRAYKLTADKLEQETNNLITLGEGYKIDNNAKIVSTLYTLQQYLNAQLDYRLKEFQLSMTDEQRRLVKATIAKYLSQANVNKVLETYYENSGKLKEKEVQHFETRMYWSLANGSAAALGDLISGFTGGIAKIAKSFVGGAVKSEVKDVKIPTFTNGADSEEVISDIVGMFGD